DRIGENIKQIRLQKGIKQIDLASSIDIEDSALRRIEAGRTNPTVKTLFLVAQALEVEVTDLFDFDTDQRVFISG
ncbi:MAG: helix-turn-helix transcriptional regulator, partial [Flavobacteriales bacterium]